MRHFSLRFKQLGKLLLTILILSSAASAQERTWQKFTSADGDWSILAPGLMIPDAEALKTRGDRGNHSYTDFAGFFAVIYRDAPKRRYYPWKFNKEDYYDRIAKDAAKAANGELIKNVQFTKGDLTGREFYVKMPNIKVQAAESPTKTTYRVERGRMFFDQKRFYIVLVVLPEEEIDSAAANNFLDSFALQ